MVVRKAPDLGNYFSAAKQSQQLSEASEEIQRLKAEIEELRNSGSTELEAQLQALRSQLQSQSAVLSIPLDEVEPNPEQPRQTFLSSSIESMSRSLAVDGQLEPIILIQRANLVIFDGERRWRSAKNLGWQSLQAVIIPEPAALHRKALLTSLHREDLNPLDKADAIVREIAENTGLESANIPRVLSTAVRRLNTQKRMNQVVELMNADSAKQEQGLAGLGLDEAEQAVLRLLLDLQLNPASIDANIFPMLSLAGDLKTAIRKSGLKGVHAMALQKLSARNLALPEEKAQSIRMEITCQVLEEELSAIQTRKLVAGVIAQQQVPSGKQNTPVRQVSAATKRIQKMPKKVLATAPREQLLELQEALRHKLAEIEEVLSRGKV